MQLLTHRGFFYWWERNDLFMLLDNEQGGFRLLFWIDENDGILKCGEILYALDEDNDPTSCFDAVPSGIETDQIKKMGFTFAKEIFDSRNKLNKSFAKGKI